MSSFEFPCIEIFSDADNLPSSAEVALEGVAKVIAIAGRIDVIDERRKIRLSYKPGEDMADQNIRWPNFRADYNLVLTERIFSSEADRAQGRHVTGRAHLRVDKPQVAVVSTSASNFADEVVAHEFGHMLGLKNPLGNGLLEGLTHCEKPSCIMYPTSEFIVYEVPRAVSMPKRWMERAGLVKGVHDVEKYSVTTGFCSDCRDDLQQAAVQKFLSKNGLNLPGVIY